MSMSLGLDEVVTNKISTLTQATYNEIIALREQNKTLDIRTEQLQSHADRESLASLIIRQATQI